jgi:hypothetical protein
MLRIAIATEPSAGANAAAVAAGALALSLAAAARPFARCAGACYCELAIRSSVLCTRATACFKTMTVRVLSSLLQRSHRCHLFFFFAGTSSPIACLPCQLWKPVERHADDACDCVSDLFACNCHDVTVHRVRPMSCLLACVSGAPSVTVTSNGLPVMRANDETGVRRFGAGSFFADCDSINSQSARKLRISVASSKALDGCLTGDTARPTGIPDMSSRMRADAHDLPRCWSPRHTGRPRFCVILEVQGEGGVSLCAPAKTSINCPMSMAIALFCPLRRLGSGGEIALMFDIARNESDGAAACTGSPARGDPSSIQTGKMPATRSIPWLVGKPHAASGDTGMSPAP